MKRKATEKLIAMLLSASIMLSIAGLPVWATEVDGAISHAQSTSEQTSKGTAASSSSSSSTSTTQPNVEIQGGELTKPDTPVDTPNKGSGTQNDPYLISTTQDFLDIQKKISVSGENKYFTLTDDIDLSGVNANDFVGNSAFGASLITIDPALGTAKAEKYFISLDGAGHKIYGLDVTLNSSAAVSIFGFLSRESVVKNLSFENIKITSTDTKTVVTGIFAYNYGTISGCVFDKISLTAAGSNLSNNTNVAGLSCADTLAIVANNKGTVKKATIKDTLVTAGDARKNVAVLCAFNSGVIQSCSIVSSKVAAAKAGDVIYTAGTAVAVNEKEVSYTSVKLDKSALTAAKFAGGLIGINKGSVKESTVTGTISNTLTASADNANIIVKEIAGALIGKNTGSVSRSGAVNVGAYIPSGDAGVYGGIAGENSGKITRCIASGNANSDSSNSLVAGIAGRAAAVETDKEQAPISDINNSYVLVSITGKSAVSAAFIAQNGVAGMIENCYWSSSVCKVLNILPGEYDYKGDLDTGVKLLTTSANKTLTLDPASFGGEWGETAFAVNAGVPAKISGTDLTLTQTKEEYKIDAKTNDIAGKLTLTLSIDTRSTVGAGDAESISQEITVPVLVKETGGNGLSAQSPVEISNFDQLLFIEAAPFAHYTLTKDIDISKHNWNSSIIFTGTLDAKDNTITVKSPLFAGIIGVRDESIPNDPTFDKIHSGKGSVTNLNIKLNAKIDTAVFGTIDSATMRNVKIKADNEKAQLVPSSSGTGVFANIVKSNTLIYACSTDVPVSIENTKLNSIGGFVGIVDANCAVIVSSGSSSDVTNDGSVKMQGTASFIGTLETNAKGIIKNCYAAGAVNAGEAIFIGTVKDSKTKITGGVYSVKTDKKGYAKKAANDEFSGEINLWKFNIVGNTGYITGAEPTISITLPENDIILSDLFSESFTLEFDKSKMEIKELKIADGEIVLKPKSIAKSLRNEALKIIHNETGLTASLEISDTLEQNEDGYFLIKSSSDLYFFAQNIDIFKTSKMMLCDDIDMSGITGYKPPANFKGEFIGDPLNTNAPFSIKNLVIDTPTVSNVGLFASVNSATIGGFTLENFNITGRANVAALTGSATNEVKIYDITIKNSVINAGTGYTGALIGTASTGTAQQIKTFKNIEVVNSQISAQTSYAGGLIGFVSCVRVSIDGVKLTDISVSVNTNCAGGLIGCAEKSLDTEIKSTVKNVHITSSNNVNLNVSADKSSETDYPVDKMNTISGSNYVGGMIGSMPNYFSVSDSSVSYTYIKTTASQALNIAGGVTGHIAGTLERVNVSNVIVNSGNAGGIAGRTASTGDAHIIDCGVSNSLVSGAVGAAGILALISTPTDAVVSGCTVDVNTALTSGSAVGGLVGDISNAGACVDITSCTFIGEIFGKTSASNGAGALVGRIYFTGLDSVNITDCVGGGTVTGYDKVGGIVGNIAGTAEITRKTAAFADNIITAHLICTRTDKSRSIGAVVGYLSNVITNDNIAVLFKNTVFSSFNGANLAYGNIDYENAKGTYSDLNKPNGLSVSPDTATLTKAGEPVTVTLSNLPNVKNFSFDQSKGWQSSDKERVISQSISENTLELTAVRNSDELAIVSYYNYSENAEVTLPVSFSVKSELLYVFKGEGTKESPYLVGNAFDLEAISEYANGQAVFALTNDIVFSEDDFKFGGSFYNSGAMFTPIGSEDMPFNGTFDGAGYKISGLKVTNNTYNALFGYSQGAVFKNLTLSDADISCVDTNSSAYSGVLAGFAHESIYENITIENSTVTAKRMTAGALAGTSINGSKAENIIVDNCTITIDSKSSGTAVGGAFGIFNGSISDTKILRTNVKSYSNAGAVAGFVSQDGDTSFENCLADKTTTVTANTTAGGILGFCDITTGSLTLDKCSSFASVTTTGTAPGSPTPGGAGGLIGQINNPLICNIKNSNAGGTVTGYINAGGFIANVYTTSQTHALNKPFGGALVENSTVSAKLSAIQSDEKVGNVIGSCDTKNVFTDTSHPIDRFVNIYYSSYQSGETAMFGVSTLNVYQTARYQSKYYDVNNVEFLKNGKIYSSVLLDSSKAFEFDSSNIKLQVNGSVVSDFSNFILRKNVEFSLSAITSNTDKLVSVSKSENSYTLTLMKTPSPDSMLVFEYANGIAVALPIDSEEIDEQKYSLNYSILNQSSLPKRLIGVMINALGDDGAYYSADFHARLGSSDVSLDAVSKDCKEIYINMALPHGYKFTVSAKGADGKALNVSQAGARGWRVDLSGTDSIKLTLSVENEKSSWGIRTIWDSIFKKII